MTYLKNISCVILMVMPLSTSFLNSSIPYQETINAYAQEWTHAYILQSSDDEIQTIIDLLLLSYEIVKESCTMIIAKLTMQQQLLKIYTPSFIDSWQENLQINQNDTSLIETNLISIKNSQLILQDIYAKFKKLIPCILKMNPKPTQTLILDLKNSLLVWGKYQQSLTNQLLTVQDEFSQAISTISDIKILFEKICQSHEVKHVHLKDAASFYAKTYKDIDIVTNHLIAVRITGILNIQQFFECFFKTYYTTLYNELNLNQKKSLLVWAHQTQKTIHPDALFV